MPRGSQKYFYPLLILMVCCHCLGAQENQDAILVSIDSNSQLERIFEELEKEYGIRFSYASESILTEEKQCKFENEPLDNVLDFLLDNESMEYKRIGDNVLVRKKSNQLVLEDEQYNQSIHIKGKVLFSENQESIPFASVYIEDSSIGTYTDSDGSFDLEVPNSYLEDYVVFHFLGYTDQRFLLKELTDEFVMVPLEVGEVDVAEIIIVNRKKNVRLMDKESALSLSNFSSAELGLLGNDISRNLQKVAGISAVDDTSAEIKIRGSDGDATLMVLDGMPLYHCSHYFGIFNAIQGNYVDDIKLYRSYFPLEYGGKTGGIVKMSSRNDLQTNNSAYLNLDLMTATGALDLSLAPKVNLMLAGRTTLGDVGNSQFNGLSNSQPDSEITLESFSEPLEDFRTNPSFNFYDLHAKLLFRPSNQSRIALNSFFSNDEYKNGFENKVKSSNDNKEFFIQGEEKEDWRNTSFSLEYDLETNKKIAWSNVVYFSKFNGFGNAMFELSKPPNAPGPGDNTLIDLEFDQRQEIEDIGIRTNVDIPWHNHILEIGTEVVRHQLDFKFDDNTNEKFKGKIEAFDVSAFAGTKFNFDRLALHVGLRSTRFELVDKIFLSPRVLVQYQQSNALNFKSSFSHNQQFIRAFNYEYRGVPQSIWVSAGSNDVPVLQSRNYMIGLTSIFDHIQFDFELYQKTFKGLTEYSVLQPGNGNSNDGPGNRDYELFKGDGFTRGIDVMISTQYKSYQTNVSYTLSESKERYKAIFQNQYFASEDDRRHQLKWTNAYRYNNFLFSVDWIYLSGRPYTDFQSLGSTGDIRDINQNDRFKRVEDYSRHDVGVTYFFGFGRNDASVAFSIINLFDIQNTKYVQTITEDISPNGNQPIHLVVGSETAMLNRLYNVSFSTRLGK